MQRELLKSKLPPGLPTPKTGLALKRRRDYSQVSWENYFDSCQDVNVGENSIFRIYKSGSSGPVLLLLHGGGFSALSWSLFTAKVTLLSNCQVVAVDCRGHGDTRTLNDLDLSIETLTDDVRCLVETLYPEDSPEIILIGHSMGGAVAVHTAAKCLIPSLIGLVVIDVVEGTALEGLSVMQSFLKGRPKSFNSIEKAIEWSVRSGQIRNLESARVSMPGQLMKCTIESGGQSESSSKIGSSGLYVISEASEKSSDKSDDNEASEERYEYQWKINLSETDKYWEGWFKDMSRLFLSCPVPKLLLVAGRDRLDKELTVAHIQGKFQLHLLPKCGHAVHEDDPEKVAEMLTMFMARHKFAELKQSCQSYMPCC
ncbi:protein phosphatase methylesterase 1-like isoform X2 [Dendronephthya gigantea]|uniref:protein phosphatase methylesterase 1-like isoform X2 n=1 Tax=Dendronephthya gigantea TaxID=151771 RepID=UPI00106C1FED|nr:protein phosphatase methylesterase 1-like isoform X2 [Dendronephthya gigantea]